jgi:hypothetical protein
LAIRHGVLYYCTRAFVTRDVTDSPVTVTPIQITFIYESNERAALWASGKEHDTP